MDTEYEETLPPRKGEFSVCIFFPNGDYQYERRYVSAEEAVKVAHSFTTRPAALIGAIKRVIITDGGDCTNFEWQFGKGVTYPPKKETHESKPTSDRDRTI